MLSDQLLLVRADELPSTNVCAAKSNADAVGIAGGAEVVAIIAREIVAARFEAFLHDKFGNYVVQTLLSTAEEPELSLLVEHILPHARTLRNTLYGKRVLAKLERRCPSLRVR